MFLSPAGAVGPAGPMGPKGDAGISTMTFAFLVPDTSPIGPGDNLIQVASKTLPAGNYALVATVNTQA